jgi:hypothetical protein
MKIWAIFEQIGFCIENSKRWTFLCENIYFLDKVTNNFKSRDFMQISKLSTILSDKMLHTKKLKETDLNICWPNFGFKNYFFYHILAVLAIKAFFLPNIKYLFQDKKIILLEGTL